MNNISQNIYVATRNPDKFKSIRRSLKLITKNVNILNIDFSIPEHKETGKNSKENALLKVKYYFKFTQDNTLAEDTSIYFDGLPPHKQPKHLAKKFIESIVKDQNSWKIFLSNLTIKSGKIEKYFCFIKKEDKKIKRCKVIIPFTLKKPAEVMGLKNFINNFIIPVGFDKTFSQMNQIEKERFSHKYIITPLTKIIDIEN